MRRKKIRTRVLYRVHAAQTLFCTQVITVPVILSSICMFVNSHVLNIDSKWSQVRQDCVGEKGGGGTQPAQTDPDSVADKKKMMLNLYKSSDTG